MSYYEMVENIFKEYSIYESPSLPYDKGLDGDLITEEFKQPLIFKTNNTMENPPDDYPGSLIHVLSDRFVKALEKAGIDNMQCFDAILINPDTGDKWETGYKAVNFIGTIDCVDVEKSDYDEIGLGVLAFRDIAIDEKKANGALCFHIPQSPDKIILHESVLDYLDEHAPELEGMEYKELLSV